MRTQPGRIKVVISIPTTQAKAQVTPEILILQSIKMAINAVQSTLITIIKCRLISLRHKGYITGLLNLSKYLWGREKKINC